jgi:nucleotide-binding universal stress UspA family protein
MDGSEGAKAGPRLLQCMDLPPGTAVHLLAAVEDRSIGSERVSWKSLHAVLEAERARLGQALETARAELAAAGLEAHAQVRNGRPAEVIVRTARELDADLVVVGSRGLTGLEGLFLGSVAREVSQQAPCPVLVAREPRNALREIVVATDGSEHARHAVERAAEFPASPESCFTVVQVVRSFQPVAVFAGGDTPPEAEPEEAAAARRMAEEAAAVLSAAGRTARVEVRAGDPTGEILRLAEERRADLIIAGARGVGFLKGLLVGSVADALLKQAPCSVLLVR